MSYAECKRAMWTDFGRLGRVSAAEMIAVIGDIQHGLPENADEIIQKIRKIIVDRRNLVMAGSGTLVIVGGSGDVVLIQYRQAAARSRPATPFSRLREAAGDPKADVHGLR